MRPVLVTGAAGSIGSAVCRLLVAKGHSVVAVDIAETPLFWLHQELGVKLVPVIASVTDINAMTRLLKRTDPYAVIHAAALKHVGMCEQNVLAAIETNALGTQRLSHAVSNAGLRFVLVSTDKAVGPSTVMGATKRVAEMVTSKVRNARIVRLVNVWESSGSLLEIVRRRVAAGEPLTLSHEKAARYFMSAPEAAEMIVNAADGPPMPSVTVTVPKVGAPQLIRDVMLAEVRRLGHDDWPINVTGLLKGEKIVEQLVNYEEVVSPVFERWGGTLHRLSAVTQSGDPVSAYYELFKLAGGA